jgi:hypothetical protein
MIESKTIPILPAMYFVTPPTKEEKLSGVSVYVSCAATVHFLRRSVLDGG